MIISQVSKDNYQIKLPSKIINIYDHTEIQNITKRVIKRIVFPRLNYNQAHQ